jgi:hypothetical protein
MSGTPVYSGTSSQVIWRGARLTHELLSDLRGGPLAERTHDLAQRDECIAELRAMATTDMATEVIEDLINSETRPLGWEVGEALAEAILEQYHGAIWPWNTARDRRTPKASLPGADLIGFVQEADGNVCLLFGEVKTSSDVNTPPGVVYGRSGLIAQLEGLATRRDLHFSLLKWLRARCVEPDLRRFYEAATARFIGSKGRDFRLVGCLMRDTSPHEDDVRARAINLSKSLSAPSAASLYAWYLPASVEDWPDWVEVPQP